MMNRAKIFIAAALIYFLLWLFCFPYFKYMLDVDAVGYLTIATRVANGDWQGSINGLWSPLNCWLLVPFIKLGFDAFTVALHLNCFIGLIALLLALQLIKKFAINILPFAGFALPIVFMYYSFAQIFGDLLQVLCLLIYLLIITAKNFWGNWLAYFTCALIITIGYYAKAYTLPFFLLHFSVLHMWYYYKTKKNYFLQAAFSVLVCIFLIIPWVLQLKQKYGVFSLMGNAGKLNMSWYLTSSKSYKNEIKLIIPPPNSSSPTMWEDPYWSQGQLHQPFESTHLFIRWLLRIGHTTLMYLKCLLEISIFAIPLLGMAIFAFFKRKLNNPMAIITSAITLLPLGFLTMHIETRYIWLLTPCLFLLFNTLINYKSKWLTTMFALSFIVYPIYSLYQLKYTGKENYEMAAILKQQNILHKKIANYNASMYDLWITCFLSNNYAYTTELPIDNNNLFAEECKRYNVDMVLSNAPINKTFMENCIGANRQFKVKNYWSYLKE